MIGRQIEAVSLGIEIEKESGDGEWEWRVWMESWDGELGWRVEMESGDGEWGGPLPVEGWWEPGGSVGSEHTSDSRRSKGDIRAECKLQFKICHQV